MPSLAKVKWNELETIEGNAAEAPVIFDWLASGDPRKARKAVAWLFAEVLHQSTPAPSASVFVPFLIQSAALNKQPARWELLALLGDLACGGDHRPSITGAPPPDPTLRAAVAKGHASYLAALDDRDWRVRSAAAFVLAWLPKQRGKSRAALVAKESHLTARASRLLAIAVLDGKQDFGAARAAVAKLRSGDALCWEHGDVKALRSRIAGSTDIDTRAKRGLPIQQRSSPLDEPITVENKTKPFAAHLADAVKTPAKRKPLAAALAKTHAPAHVLDLCARSLGLPLHGQDKDQSLSRARVYATIFEAFGEAILPLLRTAPIPGEMTGPDGESFVTSSIALPMFDVLARLDPKPKPARMEQLVQCVPLTVEGDKEVHTPILVEGLRALPLAVRKRVVEHLERNELATAAPDFKANLRQQIGL